MVFECDPEKEKLNLAKHGVDFSSERLSMKTKMRDYTDDQGAMTEFDGGKVLTRAEEKALGIPAPGRVRRIVRKSSKPARINIRMGEETLEGLKLRAAEAGLPYQTLAASVLHMVATGKLKLELVKG